MQRRESFDHRVQKEPLKKCFVVAVAGSKIKSCVDSDIRIHTHNNYNGDNNSDDEDDGNGDNKDTLAACSIQQAANSTQSKKQIAKSNSKKRTAQQSNKQQSKQRNIATGSQIPQER